MHYKLVVFVDPNRSSLEEAMAPMREDLPEEDQGWGYGSNGFWDYWSPRDLWSPMTTRGDEEHAVSVREILDGEAKLPWPTPYGFVTLGRNDKPEYYDKSRQWHMRELYTPQGFYEERTVNGGGKKWQLSYFFEAPHFEKHYNDYMKSIPGNTFAYAVDIHS